MRIFLAVIFSIALLAAQGNAEEVTLKTQKDKVSYSIGLEIGNGMKKQAIDIDLDILSKGA